MCKCVQFALLVQPRRGGGCTSVQGRKCVNVHTCVQFAESALIAASNGRWAQVCKCTQCAQSAASKEEVSAQVCKCVQMCTICTFSAASKEEVQGR